MYVHGHYGHLSIITCHSFNLWSLWFRHRGNCSEAFRPSLAPSCIQLLLGPHLWDPLLTMHEGRGHLQAKNNIWIILAKAGSSVWIIFCHSKCSNWMNAWSIYQRISRWTKGILAALWLDLIQERMLNFQQPCWRWTILLHPAYGMERTGVSTPQETPKRGSIWFRAIPARFSVHFNPPAWIDKIHCTFLGEFLKPCKLKPRSSWPSGWKWTMWCATVRAVIKS